MKNNLIVNKRIAIIGGGPVGLTAARLLQMRTANVTVYEREETLSSRLKGSSLDLHKETGQKAIKQAGLLEQFNAVARPVAQIVGNMHGKIIFKMKPDKNKPEIDRPDLRKILLESLSENTVVWGRQVVSFDENAGTYKINFQNGETAEADIVIIADGTMSKARKSLTESLPKDTGTYVIQGEISNPAIDCPNIYKIMGNANMACVQDKKTIFTHIKSDGSICVHISFRKSEKWMRENPFDFNNKKTVNNFLYDLYKEWNPIYYELFDACDDYIGFPLKVFPVNDALEPHTNITIVGDAAHVMPPFGGWGVNMGMVDAMTLTENLTSGKFNTVANAIAEYEKQMVEYALPVQQETHEADNRIHTTIAHSFERMKKNKLLELLKIIQYVAFFFLLLVVGVFWGNYFSFSRSFHLLSQTELTHIAQIGVKNLQMPMRYISMICIGLMILSAYFDPEKKAKEFYFVLTSIFLIVISLVLTVLIEVPINNQIITWTPATLPDNWVEIRNRWQFVNMIRTCLALSSFSLFITAILKPFNIKRQP